MVTESKVNFGDMLLLVGDRRVGNNCRLSPFLRDSLYATSFDCALVCLEPSRKFLDKMIEMRDTLFIVID